MVNGYYATRALLPKKRRNAGLGSYPEVSIAEVTKLGLEMHEQINKGIDPLEEKAIQANQQQWINSLTRYAFPVLGEFSLDEIQPRHIADALRPIWIDKAETASRVKQRIHAVMAWGWAHGFCTSNPVDVVEHLLPKQEGKASRTEHHPAMPWQDIPKFVKDHVAINNKSNATRSLLEFVILTACRSGEARGARRSEIDWEKKVWSIPAERMKMKTAHRVPLSDRLLAILKNQQGLHEELIFPSPRARKELSDMVLTKYLRDIKAPSSTEGRPATAHGFRSSFRDWCSENGYPRDLAERALAHTVQNKVEAAYHRTDLLEQRRPMMQAWSDFVTGAATQSDDDELEQLFNQRVSN